MENGPKLSEMVQKRSKNIQNRLPKKHHHFPKLLPMSGGIRMHSNASERVITYPNISERVDHVQILFLLGHRTISGYLLGDITFDRVYFVCVQKTYFHDSITQFRQQFSDEVRAPTVIFIVGASG